MNSTISYTFKFTLLLLMFTFSSIYSQGNYTNKQLDSIEYARGLKKFPKYKLHILAGGLFSDIDGSVTVNNLILGTGTKLDFEDNLKLEDYVTTYRFGAIYDLNDKSSFSANFFTINRSSSIILQDSVKFGEYTFEPNANLDFELDFMYLGINYTYNFVSKPQFKSGATAGIRFFDIKTVGTGTATVNNQSSTKTSENSLLAPGLLIGLNNSVYFLPNLLNRNSIEYFHIKVGTITASLFEAKIGLEYYLFRNFGVGLLAMVNSIKIISDSEEDFNGEVVYGFKGLSLFAVVRL
jgi:hypothetical protein